MLKAITNLFDTNKKELKKIQPIIDKINGLEEDFKTKKDSDFESLTQEFKLRLSRGETLEDILPEAFAAVREASSRTLGLRHYDVQLIAGVVLSRGMATEQRTGEGKTLAATLALYLNSLTEKGSHLVTVNDYLAQRDAGWNGPLFHLLGVSVGIIVHSQAYVFDPEYVGADRGDLRLNRLRPVDRKAAYGADITYGTSNEFGFDYLRDNMAQSMDRVVQRQHHFAIVDEVDSVLIDEARTPLIISAPDTQPTNKYLKFSQMVEGLVADVDYEIDEKLRTANLTDYGIKKIETKLGVDNLYEKDYDTLHHMEQALKAKTLFHHDKQYVIKDDQVIIVDEHTGRLMHGRRYSDGLHQAIEAKEGVSIQRESRTLATISIQNYFRMYEKLSGMTGTAETEAEEFVKIYNMDVMVIPTNRPVQRQDDPDLVYKTIRAKYGAIAKEVEEKFKLGQPVLLGTKSIEHNQIISKLLKKKKITHQVLNAKNHEKEAQIIADAGRPHQVTVATNIAGRGVDIVLGGAPPDKPEVNSEMSEDSAKFKKLLKQYEKDKAIWQENHDKVISLGGLHVLGTERHESRRIDNQLRGRSGRQGDPGSSRFYVALEDEIMRIFGGEQVSRLMTALKIPEDQPIEAKIVSRSIASAQSKVEGFHFDQRKNLVEYDDVLNTQREIIYKRRNKILNADLEKDSQELIDKVKDLVLREVELLVTARTSDGYSKEEMNAIVREFAAMVPLSDVSSKALREKLSKQKSEDKIIEILETAVEDTFKSRVDQMGLKQFGNLAQYSLLRGIDDHWIDHLDAIEDLRQGIWLRGNQETAIAEYKNDAYSFFERLIGMIDATVSRRILRTQLVQQPQPTIDLDNIKVQHQVEAETPPPTAGVDVDNNPFAAALARSSQKPVVKNTGIKNDKVGRNDPCPCGAVNPSSGKPYKWKKCGMISAPHHQG